MSFKKYLFLIFGIAALLRIIFVFGFLGAMPLTADPLSYAQEALEFLKEFPPHRYFFWPPGNSLLIALFYKIFGAGLAAPRILTILLGSLTTVLTAILSLQVFKNERTAKIAGLIAAVYPSSLIMSGQTTSTQPVLFIMLVTAILCFSAFKEFRFWKILFMGIILGFGCLIRPSTLSVVGILVAAGIIYLFKNRADIARFKNWIWGIPVGIAVIAAIVFPVMQHNAQYNAGWTISTNNELNFLFGNNPYTPHYKTSHFGQRDLDSLQPEETAYFKKYVKGDQRLLTLEERQVVSREARNYIFKNPGITLLRTVNRIRAFWGPDYAMSRGIQMFYGLGFKALIPLLIFESGGYIFVMLLAIAALVFLFKSGWPFEVKFLLLLTIAYQIPYMIAFSAASYHFPIIGFMMIFAAFTLEKVLKGEWKEVFLQRAFLISLLIFLFIQIEYAYFIILLA